MMNIMKKICFLFFLTLFLISWDTNNKVIALDRILPQTYYDLIKKYTLDYPDQTQLAIAIISDNDVSYIGLIKNQDSLVFIDNKDSVFEIGGVTKVFTSTILANLAFHNIIKLDEPVSDILPFKINPRTTPDRPITFKTLSNHTSGLPCYPANLDVDFNKQPKDPFSRYDYNMMTEYLQKQLTVESIAGTKYVYSDLGFALLGYLLQIKTTKPFEIMLQENVFTKYNMNSSTTDINIARKNLVKGLDSTGNTQSNWSFIAFKSAYGVLSSTNDLSSFIKANFTDDSILSLQRQQTFDSHENNAALGWNMMRLGGVNPFYWYYINGATGGYVSSVIMDPDSKIAVIILSNVSCYNKHRNNINQLCDELMEELYITAEKEKPVLHEAPLLKIALQNGWGTKINDNINEIKDSEIPIIGVWQKQISGRIITYTFTPDKKEQCDYMGDSEIDVWGYYDLQGDHIYFNDIGGHACDLTGIYNYHINNNTLKFSLVRDDCGGRINGLSGLWIRKK